MLTTLIIRTIVVLIFGTRMVVGILSQFLYFVVHIYTHLYITKYEHSVVQFNAIVTHLGLCAYISGPHPGAMSDTTLCPLCLCTTKCNVQAGA